MSSPASLPELWSGSNLSDDILCLGSGHDYAGHEAVVRNGKANAITDDDLLSA
ncbi:hypothetical protein M406DRAFT_321656 [Cryphonectria parasitica EP155]|uniref:Uncharacterized protein n=1 Tax=Cryphonectria parasitica (strain ATCC 38755 / EP155) TaxID=660469 RepID=A0A9P4Y6L9_CRYP1|nr:uncharacterized protein M406DRAFT_321656 [Cryphonectria parasitica EP155]KAF3767671.1 hypothetical protein M406DRAFT_321656 [Cryphonectria parasitica EP155]